MIKLQQKGQKKKIVPEKRLEGENIWSSKSNSNEVEMVKDDQYE